MDGSNLLTAVFCASVALFVGVLAGRIVPAALPIEWGSVAEWATTVAAFIAAGIAWVALKSWQDQMRGTSRHTAAAEALEAARLLKYHFYDARNMWWDASEFPPDYKTSSMPVSKTEEEKAWRYVFNNRWKTLRRPILRVANLRAKAAALLSEDSADALEVLARKASELRGFFNHRLEQIKVGKNIVNTWPDQDWVRKVNESFEVNPPDRTDAYSREFESKFRAVLERVTPYL
jgi:hypothetical protein